MKVIICKNKEEVALKAGEIFVESMQENPCLTLGLATGSTPIGLYNYLINAYKQGIISFKDVITFNLDEYIGIDQKHPQSYYQFMMRQLFNHVDMNKNHIHLPKNDLKTIEENIKSYNQDLLNHHIDLQVLGIGQNGHIGFNEPNTPFDQETFMVQLDENTRQANLRFFNNIQEVPKYAITMGIKNIMQSKKIVMLAYGKHKAKAINEMINGKVSTNCPASILQLHPNTIVIIDEDAASLLNKEVQNETN